MLYTHPCVDQAIEITFLQAESQFSYVADGVKSSSKSHITLDSPDIRNIYDLITLVHKGWDILERDILDFPVDSMSGRRDPSSRSVQFDDRIIAFFFDHPCIQHNLS
ncbi:hypothetical protein ES703_122102 [subsurface metagenome]